MLTSTISSNGPVSRWLETLLCKQYADIFESSGYVTLQQVCQLNMQCLLNMGVTPLDCERIIENVSVLRQTLQGVQNNYVSINQFDPMNNIDSPQPQINVKPKKSYKPKTNSDQKVYTKQNQSKVPPNLTITANNTYQQMKQPNHDAARQIANDILTMTKNTSLNSTYTCVPLKPMQNNSKQLYNSQLPYQPPQQSYVNSSSSSSKYLCTSDDTTFNSPLQSLERLVSLPETQVIDPKSVVNDTDLSQTYYDYNNENKKRSNDSFNDFQNKKFCNPAPAMTQNQQNYNLQTDTQPYYLNQPQDNSNMYNQQPVQYNNNSNNTQSVYYNDINNTANTFDSSVGGLMYPSHSNDINYNNQQYSSYNSQQFFTDQQIQYYQQQQQHQQQAQYYTQYPQQLNLEN